MKKDKTLNSNKNIIILVAIVTVIFIIGAMMYNNHKKETVSINIGGKELSATFER